MVYNTEFEFHLEPELNTLNLLNKIPVDFTIDGVLKRHNNKFRFMNNDRGLNQFIINISPGRRFFGASKKSKGNKSFTVNTKS